jgi:DNA-binding transcriptional LysR family regulator
MTDIDLAKIRQLDGSLLLVFRELIHERRTTTVATRLGLSQSAVSHALARLRELFGDPLFVRRSNGLQPTRHALEVAPLVEEIIRVAQNALGAAERFDPRTSARHFRLGAADFMCTLLAAPLLQAFEREAPQARFSFRFLVGSAALEALRRDEIDLALGRFRTLPKGFVVDPLLQEGLCVIARKGHPKVRGSINLETYLALGHVLVSISGELVGLADAALHAQGISRRVVASVPRFLIACAAVAQTDAIATIPRSLAARYAEPLGLQVVAPPFADEPFPVVAVRRQQPRTDPSIAWLLDQVRSASA